MKRVVVTGMGLVSSLGHSLNSSWSALITGQSGIRSIASDPILKNEKPYNLALVRDFEYSKWKVPVIMASLSTQVQE
jgi:3-oxoacyl-[acyl-carrier-protein] synthase II